MNPNRAAVQITRDLGDVVFVGAFAVVTHLGPYRRTRDIDFAMTSPISEEKLEKMGYRVFLEDGKKVTYTKDGTKLDIYLTDVSGIPVSRVFETAIIKQMGKQTIKVMCLEALMVSKLRAARPQDNEDLRQICRMKGREIRWGLVETLATPTEVSNLKNVVAVFSR